MDYKKLHKDTIAKLQEMVNSGKITVKTACGICADFVPESEDERIRKAIIKHFKVGTEYVSFSGFSKGEIINWIEKQGEQKSVIIIPKFRVGDEIKTANEEPLTITKIDEKGYWSEDLFICGFDEECIWDLVEQKPAFEMITPEESLGIDSETYNKIVDECIYGEQKPADKVESKFKKGDVIKRKDGDGLEWTVEDVHKDGYYTIVCADRDDFIQLDDKWELVEQNPADEVEPNFKIEKEKWYVYTQTFVLRGKIVVIKGQTYQAEKDNVIKGENGCLFIDRHDGKASEYFRLWTIQDAKEGDVLASNYSIFIFQEEYIAQKPVAYCGLMNRRFIKGKDACWTNEKCYPATKEQRNTLMKAMADAGYEFDFDKKELKKIDQKPTTDFSDLRTWKYIVDAVWIEKEGIGQYLDSPFTEEVAKKLQKRFGNIKQKSAWSEEDEKVIHCLEYTVKHFYEDECTIKWCCDWLKSIKARYTWKPSDEQMNALREAVIEMGKSVSRCSIEEFHGIESLYNDLKKLKA